MSIRNEIKEQHKKDEENETLRRAAKILSERYPDQNVDEWGNRKHFSSW